jgi:hypothetical protein
MAGRVLSRRALRDEHDQVERVEEETAGPDESPGPQAAAKKPRTRKPAAAKPAGPKVPPKPRAPRKKAVKVPPRMFARWAVCDGGLKRVAVFEYKDRAGADAKLAQMQDRKSGTFVLLLVKDPYDPPAAEAAAPAG